MPASTPRSRDEDLLMSDQDDARTAHKLSMQAITSPGTPADASQSAPEFDHVPRPRNHPAADDIALQKTGWLVLRSTAPNLNAVLTNAGVNGLKLRQLYSCEPPTAHRIHALILLYKWSPDRGDRVKWNPENSASMFANPAPHHMQDDSAPMPSEEIMFCNQTLDNASATQALITAVVNIVDGKGNHRVKSKDEDEAALAAFDLGDRISHLKSFLKPLDPILRSAVICSSQVVRSAHNDAARAQSGGHPELLDEDGRMQNSSFSDELWMYTIYLPGIGDKWVYEMEGIADSASVVGPCDPELGERWIDLPFVRIEDKVDLFREHKTPFMLFSLTNDSNRSPSPKIPRKGRERNSSTSGSKEREMNWGDASDRAKSEASVDEAVTSGDGIDEEDTPKHVEGTSMSSDEVERVRAMHNYDAFFVEMMKLMASRGDINELIRERSYTEEEDEEEEEEEYMY